LIVNNVAKAEDHLAAQVCLMIEGDETIEAYNRSSKR
jgi:hypothetical protein